MSLFYESELGPGFRLQYSATGDVDVNAVNTWFGEVVYAGGLPRIARESECLLRIVQQLISRGKMPGYEFLLQMPDDDQYEWVQKACTTACRLHRQQPDEFPAGGLKESFDQVRKWRKAKSKAKKSKKE